MNTNGKGKITKHQLSQALIDEILNSGGSSSGEGGSLAIKKYTQTITSNTSKVSIGSMYFTKETDELLVFKNSVYLELNKDYIINDDKTISKADGTQWIASVDEPDVFNFVCLMNTAEEKMLHGSKLIDSSVTEGKLDEALRAKINNNSGGGNGNNENLANSFKKIIKSNEWNLNSDGLAEYTVNHNLFQDIVSIMVYTTDTKEAVDFSYTIINNGTIKLYIQEAVEVQVILVGTVKVENSSHSSILDFCTPDNNGDIVNQDDGVAAWIASGLNLYGPRVKVYLKRPITLPKFCKISGNIEFYVDQSFTGNKLITVNQGVILEDVTIRNDFITNITLINGVDDISHDVTIRNLTLNDRIGCTGVYFKKADYLRITESQFLHHENVQATAKQYKSIVLEDSNNAIIANNTFRSFFGDSTNTYNAILINSVDGTWSLTIEGNNFSVDKVNDSKCIVLGGKVRRAVVDNNTVSGPLDGGGIDFIVASGGERQQDLYGIVVNANSVELGAGYFIYCYNANLLQSIVSNNVSINSANGVSVFGYHSVFKGNSIHGTWWGQEGNNIIALDNINANINGSWHTSSTGNINTIH